jgi:Thoeris protein ThsB, TIR-like domain
MARKVFFSFHYGRDLWRVNVVRNSGVVEGVSAAGFHDASLWEETKKKGDHAIKKLIDSGLDGTSVTVVLIGSETANRTYISYEIEKSIARGNGILGIRVNNIKDQDGKTESAGSIPAALEKIGAPVYDWQYGKLGEWVELAYRTANSSS